MVLSNKEWLNKMDEIIAAIQNDSGDSQVIEDMLSNMWSSSITYNVGDYVLYNNKIWKCLVQNSNIIPTEGDTWTSVIITNEISTLNSNLTDYDVLYQSETTINSGTNIPLSKSAYDYKKLLIVIKLSGLENRSFEIIPRIDTNSFTEVAYANNQWYLNTVEAELHNNGNTLHIKVIYAVNWDNPSLVCVYGQKYL